MRFITLWWTLALALAAGCTRPGALTVLRPSTDPLRERVTVKMLITLHGPSARRLQGGDTLHPGDELRVSIEAERKVFVYLLDVMNGGKTELLFPQEKEVGRVDPGAPFLIPYEGAFRVGTKPGAERFVLIASAQPLVEDTLPGLIDQAVQHRRAQLEDPRPCDQLKGARLRKRQKQRILDDVRRAASVPACAITQAELDAEGLALLCVSFAVRLQ